jgi:integration host factor subunit beta
MSRTSGYRKGVPMIKSELVKQVHVHSPHLNRRDVEKVVDAILDEIVSAIARGERVELRGFGIFAPQVRSARVARNPKTGIGVPLPKKVHLRFKQAKEMRERLNRTATDEPT